MLLDSIQKITFIVGLYKETYIEVYTLGRIQLSAGARACKVVEPVPASSLFFSDKRARTTVSSPRIYIRKITEYPSLSEKRYASQDIPYVVSAVFVSPITESAETITGDHSNYRRTKCCW